MKISLRLWFFTSLSLGIAFCIYSWLVKDDFFPPPYAFFIITIVALVGSLPALLVYVFTIYRITWLDTSFQKKLFKVVRINILITSAYGLLYMIFFSSQDSFNEKLTSFLQSAGTLFGCSCTAILINFKHLLIHFSANNKTTIQMETTQPFISNGDKSFSGKTIYKLVTVALLILAMLIPAYYVSNLISEREQRQKEVVEEVSEKWASEQTISGPYLSIDYNTLENAGTKNEYSKSHRMIVLPEQLDVDGKIEPQELSRSIYKVLLYRSTLKLNGLFKLPEETDSLLPNTSKIKVCLGITDFKGIEQSIHVNIGNKNYELSPGLPDNSLDTTGLSQFTEISVEDLKNGITFNTSLNLRGSELLHFLPLSASSKFHLTSSWDNPSFDGHTLPFSRQVTSNGFAADWAFNKANLPFNIAFEDAKFDKEKLAFGVSIIQPADQYAKTSRSVKYAILFIGLTFSLFFVLEIMQKKPVHPVQYVLVGIALVIFFTLLLSISEYINFNYAYLIASAATVSLISLYAKAHFQSWKIAGLFTLFLSALYGFIFFLLGLEDTSLLIGSIGLFVVLALVMYASRKINWYRTQVPSGIQAS